MSCDESKAIKMALCAVVKQQLKTQANAKERALALEAFAKARAIAEELE